MPSDEHIRPLERILQERACWLTHAQIVAYLGVSEDLSARRQATRALERMCEAGTVQVCGTREHRRWAWQGVPPLRPARPPPVRPARCSGLRADVLSVLADAGDHRSAQYIARELSRKNTGDLATYTRQRVLLVTRTLEEAEMDGLVTRRSAGSRFLLPTWKTTFVGKSG